MPGTKRIYFHVGQPKSGTTALQTAFARHSDTAQDARLLHYPQMGRLEKTRNLMGHHNLAYELYEPAKFRASLGSWADLLTEIERSATPDIVISSEAFRGFTAPVVAAKRKKLFADMRFQVVLYLRPQWSYVESGYNQLMRFDRVQGGFAQFWQDSGRRIADYRNIVTKWQQACGVENVLLQPFDKAVRDEGIVAHFVRDVLGSSGQIESSDRVNHKAGLLMMRSVRDMQTTYRAAINDPKAVLPIDVMIALATYYKNNPREVTDYTFVSPAISDEIYNTFIETNKWLADQCPNFETPAFLERPKVKKCETLHALPALGSEDQEFCASLLHPLITKKKRWLNLQGASK